MINKRNRPKFTKKIGKQEILFFASVLIFLFAFIGRLYSAASLTARNTELKDLYAQKLDLEQKISKMKFETLSLSSLDAVKTRATILGYIEHEGLLLSLDLNAPKPLALR